MVMPIPIPIPMGGGKDSSPLQIMKFQITQVQYGQSRRNKREGYAQFEEHSKYNVLAIDSEHFLIVDDNKNFVWIEWTDCKAV